MRNMLAFVAAGALTFLGVGYYLDWYQIRSAPGPMGHRNVNIDLNSPKIIQDVHKGVQKGEQKLQDVLEKQNTPRADVTVTIPTPATDRPTP